MEEIFHNEWISMRKIADKSRKISGYIFSHETRCDGKIVAVLPYRKVYNENGSYLRTEYLLRLEMTPCWDVDEEIACSITGGVEGSAHKTAKNELKEETGYSVSQKDLVFLGNSYASKSADTRYFLFTIDLTGKEQGEQTEDFGSGLWVTEDKIPQVSDPQVALLFLRIQQFFNAKK